MALTVIRGHDGQSFTLAGEEVVNLTNLIEFQNLLCRILQIDLDSLIIMHSGGWLIDENSFILLLEEVSSSVNSLTLESEFTSTKLEPHNQVKEVEIFVFNREYLDAKIDSIRDELKIEIEPALMNSNLPDYGPGSSKLVVNSLIVQHENSLNSYNRAMKSHLISLSNQRKSQLCALNNLNRHQNSKNDIFKNFEVFFEPLLENFKDLLETFESTLVLLSKIKVLNTLQPFVTPQGRRSVSETSVAQVVQHGRTTSAGSGVQTVKERFLIDFVSVERIREIRNRCNDIYVEMKNQFEDLRNLLKEVDSGYLKLKNEYEDNDLEDLNVFEEDANFDRDQAREIIQSLAKVQNETKLQQAFDQLLDIEARSRDQLTYLVDRRNAETNNQIIFLQSVSELQSSLKDSPELIQSLDKKLGLPRHNEDFKYLNRLKDMASGYIITLVEVFRRRSYARLLNVHSHGLVNLFAKLNSLESKRRNTFKIESNGKLPWDIKSLELDVITNFEIELRRPSSVGTNLTNGDSLELPEISRNDVDDLSKLLDDLETDLQEPEISSLGNLHPLRLAKSELTKALERLEQMEQDFERLTFKSSSNSGEANLLASPSPDPETAARIQHLEREFQIERGNHESELAKLAVRNSELEQSIAQVSEKHSRELNETSSRYTRLETSHANLVAQHSSLKWDLGQANAALEVAKEESQNLEKVSKDVKAQSERLLRNQKTEAELDRTLLEKEIAELRAQIEKFTEKDSESESKATSLLKANTQLETDLLDAKMKLGENNRDLTDAKKQLETVKLSADEVRQNHEDHLNAVRKETLFATNEARQCLRLVKALHDYNVTVATSLTSTEVAEETSTPLARPASPMWDTLSIPEIETLRKSLESSPSDTEIMLKSAVSAKIDGQALLVKKWQKECKAYREKARKSNDAASAKIAFRNFTKGDLALFLPTRNTTAQIWAAFNFGFPHYFLSTHGQVAELIKSREWLVARITSLVEHTVDPKDPSTNPFSLPPGTKYFILEAEPWTPASITRSKSSSSPEKLRSGKRSESYKANPQSGSPPIAPLQSPSMLESTNKLSEVKVPEVKEVTNIIPESPPEEESNQPVSLSPSNLTRSLERTKTTALAETEVSKVPRANGIQTLSQSGSDRDNTSKYSTSPAFIAPSRSRPRPLSKDYSNISTSPPFFGSTLPRSISTNLSSSRYRRPVQSVFSEEIIDHKGSPTTSTSFTFASMGSDYGDNEEPIAKSTALPIKPSTTRNEPSTRDETTRRPSSGAGSVGSTGAASVLLRRFSAAIAAGDTLRKPGQ